MDLDVRPCAPHELRAAADTMRIALLNSVTADDEWEKWKYGWEEDHTAIAAWDGDRCVGHAGAFHLRTSVPGGAWLPSAGVTRVGVLPTHTRRGVLSRMMRRLLDERRAAGDVLASLRASEAVIYGRFGFGLAGEAVGVVVDPRRMRGVTGAAPGSFRLLARGEILDVVPDLYRRMGHRPGALTRPRMFWARIFEHLLDGSKAESVVVHVGVDGTIDGYVHYGLAWEEGFATELLGHGRLYDLFGADPSVELALWDFVSRISLVRTFEVDNRPVDDLVLLAVPDVRAYAVKERWDEQWLRVLDVEAALLARTYGEGAPVAIAVSDPWYPDNGGTYLVGDDGVERTSGPAELVAPIDAFSAAYMGSVAWRDLVAAGRVRAEVRSAAARADALFAHHPTSWSGTFF